MLSERERLQEALPRRYRILRELDGAGMSRVYLAREELPERDVAIKVLDEALSARLGRQRFVREVEVTSKLSHPHIVPIYAAGDAGGTLYYVMPYIDGESLRDRLARESQLPLADALRITGQVADALQHAHDRGVVHRDIKPSNILLQSGFAVIADFGIARALSAAEEGRGGTGNVPIGTPDYMSPEQAAGDSDVDGRADQYALACVLYEMLAGEPPFRSRSTQATLARHVTQPVPPIGVHRSTVPPEVERCIRKALSKSPSDRFVSVAAFARALDLAPRSAEGSWIARRGGDEDWRLGRLAPKVAVTLLVIGALGFAWRAWTGPPRELNAEGLYRDSVAVMPFENRTGNPTFEFLGQSIAEEVTGHLAEVQEIKAIDTYSVRSLWGENLGIPRLLDTLDVGHLIRGFYEIRSSQLVVVVSELDGSGAVRDQATHRLALEGLDTLQIGLAHEIAQSFLDHVGIEALDVSRDVTEYGPARDAYLAGNSWLGQRTPEGLGRAIDHFRDAVALDGSYAPAHAALSSSYSLALYYKYDVGIPGYALAAMALSAADRAIELDPELSSGYSSRGYIRAVLGIDINDAESDFERALELAPNRPDGPSWSARILAMRGRTTEALTAATRARDLDPLAAGRRMGVATLALQLGDLQLSLDEAREARRLEPSLAMARALEGRVLALMGRSEECLAVEFEVYPAVEAICLHRAGRKEEARERIAMVEAQIAEATTLSPGFLDELAVEDVATYYGFVGDAVRAANWVRRAFDLSPNGVDARLLGSALFDPVRGTPDYDVAILESRDLAQRRVRSERIRLESDESISPELRP